MIKSFVCEPSCINERNNIFVMIILYIENKWEIS